MLTTVVNALKQNELDPLYYTVPLRKETGQHVVSVSNMAKRFTENDIHQGTPQR